MPIEAPHTWTVRIYYEDTDFSGVVYHANYLRFLERARTEYLRDLGVSHSTLTDERGQALTFVVRRMTIDFHAPARMDDLIRVETKADVIGGASLSLGQRVVKDALLLVSAAVKIALVSGGRPRRIPSSLALLFTATS